MLPVIIEVNKDKCDAKKEFKAYRSEGRSHEYAVTFSKGIIGKQVQQKRNNYKEEINGPGSRMDQPGWQQLTGNNDRECDNQAKNDKSFQVNCHNYFKRFFTTL